MAQAKTQSPGSGRDLGGSAAAGVAAQSPEKANGHAGKNGRGGTGVNGGLIRLDAVRRFLAEASDLNELLDVRRKVEAAALYARRTGLHEAQNDLAEAKLRIDRRIGQVLAEVPREKGGRPAKNSSHNGTSLQSTGLPHQTASRLQAAASVPEPAFEAFIAETRAKKDAEITQAGVLRLAKEAKREKRRARKAAIPDDLPPASERFRVERCRIAEAAGLVGADSIDAILTDPPYPKEYLPVYRDLARLAAHALKPGGSLVVMCGQSYLPEILQEMDGQGVAYNWTFAYLTPGGQSAQLWQRKVNTFWKPLLWFVKGEYRGDWHGDVLGSEPNDNDKRFHAWGQSESGMSEIVNRFTDPGQTILDPFCGGGTTGVVAVQMGRLFVGLDADDEAVRSTVARLHGAAG